MILETVKVKRDSKKGYHIINKSDFDPKKHELFDEGQPAGNGMTVAQLKEALTAKGIEIPADAKKADLQALLDAAE